MKAPLSVIAVDDHKLFLKGIADCLREMPVVGHVQTCTTYAGLMQALCHAPPDIIFLDLNIPPHDGFSICGEVKRIYPAVFVAMLTQYNYEAFVQKAKKVGAGAYFIKNTDLEVFAHFLNSLANEDIKGFFAHVPSVPSSAAPFARDIFERKHLLTRREREIVALLAKGISHTEVENLLGISNSTYKMHRANIMHKLHVSSDIALGVFAAESGLREMSPE